MKKDLDIKITDTVLSIPPYISTAWANVLSLHVEDLEDGKGRLVLNMSDGKQIKVPGLSEAIIEQIFKAHSDSIENLEHASSGAELPFPFPPMPGMSPDMMGLPLRLGPGGIESLGNMMEHDEAQADADDIPEEILEKIGSIVKVLGVDEGLEIPQPEPDCKCMHCQISRCVRESMGLEVDDIDEEVRDEELSFKTWDIERAGDQLFAVINPLDDKERYNVFLGAPVGCTCGQDKCEHIQAALQSPVE